MVTNMLTVPQQATCSIISSGWFPDVWILCADLSENSNCSIFIGGVSRKNSFSGNTTYGDGTDSVPKGRHIKFRRRGITQNIEYKVQNTAKVWNEAAFVAGCRAEPGADWRRHRRAALDQEESQCVFLQKHGQLLLHLSPKLSVMSGKAVITPYS